MAKYAFVENDTVTEVLRDLPRSFRNVSNFYLLPENERNSYGWYDVVLDTQEVTPDSTFEGFDYSFSNGVVTETKNIQQRTLVEYKQYLIELLKPTFDKKMRDEFPDYEQRLAALGLLPTAYVNNMKTVLQGFLTQFGNYKDTIEAATDYATLNNYYDLIVAWSGA